MSNVPAVPTMRSRVKEAPLGTEEAGTNLNLGELENSPCLSISEARLLIQAVVNQRKGTLNEGETLQKTQDYLEAFARFRTQTSIGAVEQILNTRQDLQYFERSQLFTLCCETAEEAKTLIPSLANKIADEELQEILDEINKLRNFVD